MGDIFKFVKDYVTAKDVAIHYGFRPNRSNLICCPFHDDKHPSMKVDRRYFCFGCGAQGDAIDFVSEYFGIGLKDAVLKIVDDFGIGSMMESAQKRKQSVQMKPIEITRYSTKKSELTDIVRRLMDYKDIVRKRMQESAPPTPEDEMSDAFAEEVDALVRASYLIDGCLVGAEDEKWEFYQIYKEEVDELVREVARDEEQTRRRARAK